MVNETGFQLKVIIINVYLVTGLHTSACAFSTSYERL